MISVPPLAATVERSGLGTRRPLAAVGLGTVGVLVIAVALVPFHATVPRPIPIVLLLLPVVAAGVVGGRLAAGAVTVEAVAVLATGFLPPVFSPRVTLAEDIAALAVFVAVAVVLGSLVAHVVAADRHRIALGEARAVALEQVDRQRRTLLSSVSHDLRTPLATIRAVATDLWSGAPHDESTRTELLGLVVDESERLDRIVANLLSLSRIEGGTFSPDRQPVDVTDLVRDLDGPFGAAPRRSRRERRRARRPPSRPRRPHPDRPGRDQPARERSPALTGRGAGPGRGRVRGPAGWSSACPMPAPASIPPSGSACSSRSGPRATACPPASAWPPARRSWRPTAVPSPCVTDETAGRASPSRSPSMADATVLLVDDEPALVRAVTAGLEARGYRVRSSLTGTAAIAAAASAEPDVTLLDLGLPDLDGVEVCRELRRHVSSPIIVLSADGAVDRKVAAFEEGADDYVTKPFSMPELLARIAVAVRHRRALAAIVDAPVVAVGPLAIDVAGHQARPGRSIRWS